MKLTNLQNVKGYEAGKHGNLLVSLDDNLVQQMKYPGKKKDREIRMYCCTAYVDDPHVQEALKKFTDGTVPVDRIIVVNKKFMKLASKSQLILLYKQNAREDIVDTASCDKEVESYSNVATMEQFGVIRTRLTLDKARKFTERDERKAAAAARRCKSNSMQDDDFAIDDNVDLDDETIEGTVTKEEAATA